MSTKCFIFRKCDFSGWNDSRWTWRFDEHFFLCAATRAKMWTLVQATRLFWIRVNTMRFTFHPEAFLKPKFPEIGLNSVYFTAHFFSSWVRWMENKAVITFNFSWNVLVKCVEFKHHGSWMVTHTHTYSHPIVKLIHFSKNAKWYCSCWFFACLMNLNLLKPIRTQRTSMVLLCNESIKLITQFSFIKTSSIFTSSAKGFFTRMQELNWTHSPYLKCVQFNPEDVSTTAVLVYIQNCFQWNCCLSEKNFFDVFI